MTDRVAVRRGHRPRGLVFAYSAEPDRGSEPGGGWGVVMALSRVAELTVLVKSEHVPAIRRWERRSNVAGLTFVEIDPRVPTSIQKFHRITEFLTYLHWLRAARRTARRLQVDQPFDFAHHVTYSVYWLPTPATDLGIPSLWGPAGGGVRAPRALWPILGIRGLFDELLDRFAVSVAARHPATRRTWLDAGARIVQNEETRDALPADLRAGTHVLNAAMLTQVAVPPFAERDPVIVFPSALVSRKCPRLALEALVHAPGVRLQFVHTGPQERMLRRRARKLGLLDRVEFLGQVPRGELFERIGRASAALFTGVREEGGLALAEAMCLGTPVVVLSVGGARTICDGCVDSSRVTLVDPESLEGVASELGRAMHHAVTHPHAATTPNLDRSATERRLRRVLERVIGQPPGTLGDPDEGDVQRQYQTGIQTAPCALSHVASATGGD